MPAKLCAMVGLDAPKTAAALVIGNELLSGKVEDANIAVLARTLRGLGVELRRVVLVLDDVETIVREVRELAAAHDWLFTSGGVGPTHDDVTIDAVAAAFATDVVEDPSLAAMIRAHYGDRCTEGHVRMARVPRGATLEIGESLRWPAVRLRNVWLLPGVPEIFRMKLELVTRALAGGRAFVTRALFVQLDEGELKPLLDEVVAQFADIDVGSYPKWQDPTYKTKITFDGRDEARVLAAASAFRTLLPAGEPQWET